ncbi:hypothetical protein KKC1_27240 [Calderihabitans maritimus]|uniref:Uncharacterized protein n=1 Tax=Calderihabitans maritimus TaxID=1246530 RepID=A0A1Z5HWA4_9FIRM|nr:hypothetical protein KKC1_27240 [Calderihabitans maritimus]
MNHIHLTTLVFSKIVDEIFAAGYGGLGRNYTCCGKVFSRGTDEQAGG